jgi:hypothetical protein
VAFFQSGQARQWAASSRRVLRLDDAPAMGIFRLLGRISLPWAGLNAGQAVGVLSIPLGILMKNTSTDPD